MEHKQHLVEYIRTYSQQGYAEATIRNYLLQKGWSDKLVNDAFADYFITSGSDTPAPRPTRQPKQAAPRKPAVAAAPKLQPLKPLPKPVAKSEPQPTLKAVAAAFGPRRAPRAEPELQPKPVAPRVRLADAKKQAAVQPRPKTATVPITVRLQPLVQKLRRPRLVAAAAGLVVVIGGGLIIHNAIGHHSSAAADAPSSAEIAAAQNTNRQHDIDALVSGIKDYTGFHIGGKLPQAGTPDSNPSVFDLCGTSCDDGGKTQITLRYYKPANVQFQTYTDGLSAPDLDTIYLVYGATCDTNGASLGAVSDQPTISLLYNLQSGPVAESKCTNV